MHVHRMKAADDVLGVVAAAVGAQLESLAYTCEESAVRSVTP